MLLATMQAPQMAAAQPQAQPQQQHQQQPLQQGQRGTQSATWPQSWPHARRMVHHQLGQTLARHPQAPLAQHMPPAVAGQAQLGWDQGDYEPPLQFRRGPTADFWYARQAAQDRCVALLPCAVADLVVKFTVLAAAFCHWKAGTAKFAEGGPA